MTIPTNQRRFMRNFGVMLAMLGTLLLNSCHSSRQASGSIHPTSGSNKAYSQSELKTMLKTLESSYKEWSDVKIPVTARLKSPKKLSVGGTLTMKRGENIHLSLRFLGMEVAALMVTQDSVFALYKLEKLYFAESIADMLGGFPATVSNVQDLLLGRAFALGDSPLTSAKCRLEGDRYNWTITPSDPIKGIGYSFSVDTPTGNVEKLTVSPGKHKPITADYSDFTVSATGPMAETTSVKAEGGKTIISAELDLNGRRADWDSGASKTWATPKGYTRVKAADIMKRIKF